MSGRHSRRKGATAELAVAHIGQAAGFAVTKRSGMYVVGHDLDWPLLGVDRRVEIKRHAAGQGRLYGGSSRSMRSSIAVTGASGW